MRFDIDELDLSPTDKNILRFMILFIILLAFILFYFGNDEKKMNSDFLKIKFSGIVDSTYIDNRNHNESKIRLNTGKHISNYFKGKAWDIKVGDSVLKSEGDGYIKVYRDKELFYNINLLE